MGKGLIQADSSLPPNSRFYSETSPGPWAIVCVGGGQWRGGGVGCYVSVWSGVFFVRIGKLGGQPIFVSLLERFPNTKAGYGEWFALTLCLSDCDQSPTGPNSGREQRSSSFALGLAYTEAIVTIPCPHPQWKSVDSQKIYCSFCVCRPFLHLLFRKL